MCQSPPAAPWGKKVAAGGGGGEPGNFPTDSCRCSTEKTMVAQHLNYDPKFP